MDYPPTDLSPVQMNKYGDTKKTLRCPKAKKTINSKISKSDAHTQPYVHTLNPTCK